jgi:hypothetical protein
MGIGCGTVKVGSTIAFVVASADETPSAPVGISSAKTFEVRFVALIVGLLDFSS